MIIQWNEKRFVSPANIIACRILEALYRSLIQMIKSSEPNIDPCGAPHVIS